MRVVNKWIELGRGNTPGFVEFTNAIDLVNAELGHEISGAIMDAAKAGDLSAFRWLYDKRLSATELHRQKQWLAVQDKAEASVGMNVSEESLEEAERRLEQVNAVGVSEELH